MKCIQQRVDQSRGSGMVRVAVLGSKGILSLTDLCSAWKEGLGLVSVSFSEVSFFISNVAVTLASKKYS